MDFKTYCGEYERERIRHQRITLLRQQLKELDYDINACEDGVAKAKTLEEYRTERVVLRNELRALLGKAEQTIFKEEQ